MQAIRIGALIALLAISCAAASEPSVEEDALLALPWKQFDQTLGSGWRVYAMRDEHLLAARLIERYLAERSDLTPVQRAVSHFHAGAELARVNLHKEALSHFDQASVPPGSKGVPEDWNELVTANKAFLLGDRTALLACSFDGSKDETELSFTFKRPDDPERRLKLTLLAFDIPAENS